MPVFDDFLYNGAYLVDFYRVYDEVLRSVAVFIGSLGEACGCLLNAVVDDVGEAYKNRC